MVRKAEGLSSRRLQNQSLRNASHLNKTSHVHKTGRTISQTLSLSESHNDGKVTPSEMESKGAKTRGARHQEQ